MLFFAHSSASKQWGTKEARNSNELAFLLSMQQFVETIYLEKRGFSPRSEMKTEILNGKTFLQVSGEFLQIVF